MLIRRGFVVYALAPNFTLHSKASVIALGAIPVDYKLSRTGMNPFVDIYNMFALAYLLRQIKPYITLAYFIKPVIYGSLAAWIVGVPKRFAMIEGLGFVFTPNSETAPISRCLLRKAVQLLYKLALFKASLVIFLNADDQKDFVNKNLLPKYKTYLLGGIGVDLTEWAVAPAVTHPLTFIMVARLLREKGVLEFVHAAKLVKKNFPEIRFVLLGDIDPNPGSLSRELAQGWVADGLVEWPGHTPVKPWLQESSVFVLPSYREGVPISTQEAMAMGRAIITTDVPGCRETVIEGVNGFLVPARDVLMLASAMKKFIDYPDLIKKMGAESRRIAEDRFNVHKTNSRLIDALAID